MTLRFPVKKYLRTLMPLQIDQDLDSLAGLPFKLFIPFFFSNIINFFLLGIPFVIFDSTNTRFYLKDNSIVYIPIC